MRIAADTHKEIVQEGLQKELLRFTTAGSVDDGKSTLIGRLLYDSKAIFEDQYEALERSSKLRGEERVELAHLTDGLRAEREQGITIDVAYRYFETPKRKFIIADTPGHEQYTRNMVTGASTADLAIILVDARNGVLTQSKRHGFIASLLGIPHVLVAVNKMDLVDYSQQVFDKIVADYTAFSRKLNVHDISFVPISALEGDNVVSLSDRTPWFEGASVLHYLEHVTIAADSNLVDFRFPVQYVIRPHQDFRGYAGKIKSGVIRPGEEVIALPSRKRSRVKKIVTYEGQLDEAGQGESVTLELTDQLDISRGDMLVRPGNMPHIEDNFDAILSWMDDDKTITPGKEYILQHENRTVKARIEDIIYKIDVNTLHRVYDKWAELNEIARVDIRTGEPLFFDPYTRNRWTGSFILIDPATYVTVGAGLIQGIKRDTGDESIDTKAGQKSAGKASAAEVGKIERESEAIQEAERILAEKGYNPAVIDKGLYQRVNQRFRDWAGHSAFHSAGSSIAETESGLFILQAVAFLLETANVVIIEKGLLTEKELAALPEIMNSTSYVIVDSRKTGKDIREELQNW